MKKLFLGALLALLLTAPISAQNFPNELGKCPASAGSALNPNICIEDVSGDVEVQTLNVETSLEIDNVAVTSTAAELNLLDGVTATSAELDAYAITVTLADISSAQSVWVVAPHAGAISAIYTVIDTAITTGDATITAEIGGTLVTGSSITIANSGSAAGDVDSSTPSAANTVTAGQAIEIITDGGSTVASRATVTLLITR